MFLLLATIVNTICYHQRLLICLSFFFSLLFICIYFMLNLFPGHTFLFPQFLLGYLFLLCNLFFCFRNNLLCFSEGQLSVAGKAHARVVCRFCAEAVFTWMCSVIRESASRPCSSAFLSAFLSTCSKNSALFVGHRPCVQPLCLAWAHLSTPPL